MVKEISNKFQDCVDKIGNSANIIQGLKSINYTNERFSLYNYIKGIPRKVHDYLFDYENP